MAMAPATWPSPPDSWAGRVSPDIAVSRSASGTPIKIFADFFALEESVRNGVFITVGDIDGDGFAEVIAGGGPTGGPRIIAYSGKDLIANQYVEKANFFGGDPNNRGGIHLATRNLDGDARADLIVGTGDGAPSRVNAYLGKNIRLGITPPTALDFDPFNGFTGGVFVG